MGVEEVKKRFEKRGLEKAPVEDDFDKLGEEGIPEGRKEGTGRTQWVSQKPSKE